MFTVRVVKISVALKHLKGFGQKNWDNIQRRIFFMEIKKRKLFLTLGSVFGALFLFGCTSFSVQPKYFQSVGETDAGTPQKAYVGDVLYTKYDYESRDFYRLTAEINCGLSCKISATDQTFLASVVNGKNGACGPATQTQGMMRITIPVNLCVIDEDQDQVFEAYQTAQLSGKIKNTIPYLFQTADSVRGKKKELIYQGKDDNTLRFRYREYINDIVRPAFDQTVEYNLESDNVVTFRGMRLLVDEANNQEINYRIVSGTIEL